MASKYRPRNPLKPTTGPNAAKCPIPTKPHQDFTGMGDEAITGKGGGWIRFKDGRVITSGTVTVTRKWTLEDSAYCARIRAKSGAPPDEEESARLAAALLEAITTGQDHEIFNRIADLIRDPREYLAKQSPSLRDLKVMDAVIKAANNAAGIPTVQQVGAILYAIPFSEGKGHLFTTANRADKVCEMLEKIGFQWLPRRGRGEHLRQHSP